MEPKAVETGQIVSERLGIPVETAQNLHEHERPSIDLDTLEQFQDKVARLLENPGERVFGAETGEQARKRFSAAVSEIMTCHPAGNMVIVTHGTVMTLFVAHAAGIDPVPFWKGLGLPALVVLSYPDLSLVEVIESVV
jgi:broad specificity phosphatase PhoE